MKILIDAHVLEGFSQGSKTYMQALYAELIKSFPEHEYYFFCRNIVKVKKIFPKVGHNYFIKSNFSSRLLSLGIGIPYTIWKHKFDVLHTNYYLPFFKLKSCSYIVTIHDALNFSHPEYFTLISRIKNTLFFNQSAFMATKIITVSNYSKVQLEKSLKFGNRKILAIPNGIFTGNSCEPMTLAAPFISDKFILSVNRFEPRKNQAEILRSYLNLGLYQIYELVFVGVRSAPYIEFDTLLAQVPAKIKKHIHFFENISVSELNFLYQNCRLFIYSSHCEGFGLPPLEAAANGAPVITSNATSMQDFSFFKPGLYTPGNTPELEKLIRLYLRTPKFELQRIEAVREYTWKRSAADHMNAFVQSLMT